MTKTFDFSLLFVIAGFILAMVFGLTWWQALIVVFVSSFTLKWEESYR